MKPGFWMAGARGRVLARAFACWACCAPPFEGSAWEHVAAAFCPGYGFLGGACDANVASDAPGGLDVCGCGVWTACLYLAGDLWSRQPCDAASVTFFIHSLSLLFWRGPHGAQGVGLHLWLPAAFPWFCPTVVTTHLFPITSSGPFAHSSLRCRKCNLLHSFIPAGLRDL